jgi:hypothetical protein
MQRAHSSAWIEWLPAEQLVEGSSPSEPESFFIRIHKLRTRFVKIIISHLTRSRIDRTILAGEAISLFTPAVKNPATRNPYERRLINFLNKISMTTDEFVQTAKIAIGEKEPIRLSSALRRVFPLRWRKNYSVYIYTD